MRDTARGAGRASRFHTPEAQTPSGKASPTLLSPSSMAEVALAYSEIQALPQEANRRGGRAAHQGRAPNESRVYDLTFEQLSEKTGVPAFVISILHWPGAAPDIAQTSQLQR